MTGPTPRAGAPGAPPARRRRRWHRLVIPFIVVALLWLTTAVARAYQEPDLDDAGTLSPTGTGRHGSSELARRLAAEGVSVIRVTSSEAALAAADSDATIFVPTPDLLHFTFMSRLSLAAGRHRIVLVRPSVVAVSSTGQFIWVAHSRWATKRAAPGCQAPYVAGPATVRRDSYSWDDGSSGESSQVTPTVCYGGSMVSVTDGDDELILVGATEPFRNDRLAEDTNAALATGLLTRHTRLIWVDVHREESTAAPLRLHLPQYRRGDRNRGDAGDSAFGSFPAPLWAVLVLLLVGAALFSAARARRLGPPVAEPLPVLVPATETVTGRGRLYQLIRARQASLDTLRAAAVTRLARSLDPLARAPERQLEADGPARDEFLRTVAAQSGVDEQTARTVLFGPPPTSDSDLVAATADLDRLVAAVLTPTKPPGGAP